MRTAKLALALAIAGAMVVAAPSAAASVVSFCGELGGTWDGQYCRASVQSERNSVRDIKVALPAELVDDPLTGPVVRDYLSTLMNNWKTVGVKMVADSFGEGNYQIFRRGDVLSAVFRETYHADGPTFNNAYRTFTFDMASGTRLQLADLLKPGADRGRDPAAGAPVHRPGAGRGAAAAPAGHLPVHRRPLDPGQGVLGWVQGLGTDTRRTRHLHAGLSGRP